MRYMLLQVHIRVEAMKSARTEGSRQLLTRSPSPRVLGSGREGNQRQTTKAQIR
ncbi:hypothetical protein D3C80_676060 [compost metagenome]